MKLRDIIEKDMEQNLRERGEGECIDCGADSKTYYRCFGCNKRHSIRKKQREIEKKDNIKKVELFSIEKALECKKNGGKCKHIICPNCRPMDGDDGPIDLEFLQKKYNLI